MASQEAIPAATLRSEAASVVARLQTAIGHLEGILFKTHGISKVAEKDDASVTAVPNNSNAVPTPVPSVGGSVSSAHGALDELHGLIGRIESSL